MAEYNTVSDEQTEQRKRRGRGAAWLARRSVTPVAASSNLVVPASMNKRDHGWSRLFFYFQEYNESPLEVNFMREELYSWKYESIAEKLKNVLEKRAFDVYIAKNKDELIDLIKSLIPKGVTVTSGGSLSVSESGVLDVLKSGEYNFLDRTKAKSLEERKAIELAAFTCDFYICSANAITEDGKLVFLDGNGNRAAAVIYGPKNVLLIASVNKVVKDLDDARKRMRYISPMNSKRLNLKTPCTVTGMCHDCASEQRICNYFVVVESSFRQPKRIKVILTTFELGL